MDETLKRLLDAETRSEQIVEEAKAKREEITRQALEEARRAEQRFGERIPDLHGSFVEKAEGRAAQSISELQRRYDERNQELRSLAQEHESDAIDTALALLLDTGKG